MNPNQYLDSILTYDLLQRLQRPWFFEGLLFDLVRAYKNARSCLRLFDLGQQQHSTKEIIWIDLDLHRGPVLSTLGWIVIEVLVTTRFDCSPTALCEGSGGGHFGCHLLDVEWQCGWWKFRLRWLRVRRVVFVVRILVGSRNASNRFDSMYASGSIWRKSNVRNGWILYGSCRQIVYGSYGRVFVRSSQTTINRTIWCTIVSEHIRSCFQIG